jgi:hypothetical protein
MIQVGVREHRGIHRAFLDKLKMRRRLLRFMFRVHSRVQHDPRLAGINQIRIGTNPGVPAQTSKNHSSSPLSATSWLMGRHLSTQEKTRVGDGA